MFGEKSGHMCGHSVNMCGRIVSHTVLCNLTTVGAKVGSKRVAFRVNFIVCDGLVACVKQRFCALKSHILNVGQGPGHRHSAFFLKCVFAVGLGRKRSPYSIEF